jgi:AraC-like DNA-binding protein/quercetin dioxygenase-like cupin family protein
MNGSSDPRGRNTPTYSLSEEHVELDPAFPVYMFAFSLSRDPISNLHCHDALEIGLCVKGNGIFIIGNSLQPYESEDIVVILPGQYHRAKSGTGMDDLWYFFYFQPGDWCPYDAAGLSGRLIASAEDPELLSLVKIFVAEMNADLPERKLIVAGLIRAIVGYLVRKERSARPAASAAPDRPRVIDERINKAIDFMFSSDTNDFDVNGLAARCNLSESHFRRLFREQTGMNPKHFKTKLQINTAMNLLRRRKLKIIHISEQCGFESLSSFNRLFSKETGLTPSQWRELQSRS